VSNLISLTEQTASDGEVFALGENGSVPKGQLRRFIKIMAPVLDEMKGLIDAMQNMTNVDTTDIDYLPYMAALLGLQYNSDIPTAQAREEIKQTVPWNKRKGTKEGCAIHGYRITKLQTVIEEFVYSIKTSNRTYTFSANVTPVSTSLSFGLPGDLTAYSYDYDQKSILVPGNQYSSDDNTGTPVLNHESVRAIDGREDTSWISSTLPGWWSYDFGSLSGTCSTGVTGTCSTNGLYVTGSGFDGFAGNIIINGVSYAITSVIDSNNLTIATSAGIHTNVTFSMGNVVTWISGTPFTGFSGSLYINGSPYTVMSVVSQTRLILTSNAPALTVASFTIDRRILPATVRVLAGLGLKDFSLQWSSSHSIIGTCTTNVIGSAYVVTHVSGDIFTGLSGSVNINGTFYAITSIAPNGLTMNLLVSAGIQLTPVPFENIWNDVEILRYGEDATSVDYVGTVNSSLPQVVGFRLSFVSSSPAPKVLEITGTDSSGPTTLSYQARVGDTNISVSSVVFSAGEYIKISASGYPSTYAKVSAIEGDYVTLSCPLRQAYPMAATVQGLTTLLKTVGVHGVCDTSVSGTDYIVTLVTGSAFTGLSGSITINGIQYTILSVTGPTSLKLTTSAGTQNGVGFQTPDYTVDSTNSTVTIIAGSTFTAGNGILLDYTALGDRSTIGTWHDYDIDPTFVNPHRYWRIYVESVWHGSNPEINEIQIIPNCQFFPTLYRSNRIGYYIQYDGSTAITESMIDKLERTFPTAVPLGITAVPIVVDALNGEVATTLGYSETYSDTITGPSVFWPMALP
jgi:hypothetical protein